MGDLARITARQAREIEQLKRRERGRVREGRVVAVDETAGRFRVDVGREGSQLLTPWIPAETLASGALKMQAEPTMGQHVRVTTENGDLSDAVISASGFDDGDPRPHGKAGEFAATVGDTTILWTGTRIVLSVGEASITITDGSVEIVGATAIEGPGLEHNGTNVGDDHAHTGVTPGSATTGSPQ